MYQGRFRSSRLARRDALNHRTTMPYLPHTSQILSKSHCRQVMISLWYAVRFSWAGLQPG